MPIAGIPVDGRCLSVAQPPFSLLKFSVPFAAAPQALILAPTDDTSLRAGAFQKVSLTGAEPSLTVSTSTTADQVLICLTRSASLRVPRHPASGMGKACLQLTEPVVTSVGVSARGEETRQMHCWLTAQQQSRQNALQVS